MKKSINGVFIKIHNVYAFTNTHITYSIFGEKKDKKKKNKEGTTKTDKLIAICVFFLYAPG